MTVLNPDHLLDQANLLTAPRGGGAPRQADLRRAISGAYYALFHAILTAATDFFVGSTQRDSVRYALVYRSVDHKVLRALCENVVKSTLPAKYGAYAPRGGFGPDLAALATALIDLQEKRLAADYDPLFRVKMSDAVLAVAASRAALVRFRAAAAEKRNAFLALAVFSPR